MPNKKHGEVVKKKKWGICIMALLIIGSFLMPIIGIGFGCWGLSQEEKKAQGGILLAIGILMGVGYMIAAA